MQFNFAIIGPNFGKKTFPSAGHIYIYILYTTLSLRQVKILRNSRPRKKYGFMLE